MSTYAEFVKRNAGYVTEAAQATIAETHLLIAGCGIGSSIAEACVRLGYLHFTLADGDTVSTHNLNRQAFTSADVGTSKTAALARRLRAIQPDVDIREVGMLDATNVQQMVGSVDVVLDTIDFLDIAGIAAVHAAAHAQHKPLITAVAAGFGAAAMVFPVGSPVSFADVFGIPKGAALADLSYVELFAGFMQKLTTRLDPLVVSVVQRALTVMADGTPCPAPQVAPGAASVAALATTLLVRMASGLPVTVAPELIVVDFMGAAVAPGVVVTQAVAPLELRHVAA